MFFKLRNLVGVLLAVVYGVYKLELAQIPEQLLVILSISLASLAVIFHGFGGIFYKEIEISRHHITEKHSGASAQYWGILYVLFGIIVFLVFLLASMDFFYTGKFDLRRLVH